MAERTREAVQSEYFQVCATLGDRTFKLDLLTKEIAELKAKCSALNNEAANFPKPEVSNGSQAAQ